MVGLWYNTMFHRFLTGRDKSVSIFSFFVLSDCVFVWFYLIQEREQEERWVKVYRLCRHLLLQIDSDGTENSTRIVVGCVVGASDGGGGGRSCRGGSDRGWWRRHGPDGRLAIGRWWSVGDGHSRSGSSGRCSDRRQGRIQSDAVRVETDCDAHGAHSRQPNCINPFRAHIFENIFFLFYPNQIVFWRFFCI